MFPTEARGAVLAIGNFDGVHRGHQALLRPPRQAARELGAPAGVIVFEPHPREFFQPDEPHFRLTPLPQKLALLREPRARSRGRAAPSTPALAALSAEDFIERVLVAGARRPPRRHRLRLLLRQEPRRHARDACRRAGEKLGFGVTVVAPVAEDGEVFSSSAIRCDLAQGDVQGRRADARALVARRGQGRRRRQARHRARLSHRQRRRCRTGTALGHGIYAVRVHVDGERHDGAAYLGTRPTFDDGMPVLEVFLFDFDGDLYGREIEVEFVDFIRARPQVRQQSRRLKAQMAERQRPRARRSWRQRLRPASPAEASDAASARETRLRAQSRTPSTAAASLWLERPLELAPALVAATARR